MIAPLVSVVFAFAVLAGVSQPAPPVAPSPAATASASASPEAPSSSPEAPSSPSEAPSSSPTPLDFRSAPPSPDLASPMPDQTTPPPPQPSPQTSSSPAPAATKPPDRAEASKEPNLENLLGDKWSCKTYAGTKLSHKFSQSEDGRSITVTTSVPLPKGRALRLVERYKFDPRARMWTANIASGALIASAAQWTGRTWRFTGNSMTDGVSQKVEMNFEPAGRDAFRREFRHPSGGGWSTYSGETCRRSLRRSLQ